MWPRTVRGLALLLALGVLGAGCTTPAPDDHGTARHAPAPTATAPSPTPLPTTSAAPSTGPAPSPTAEAHEAPGPTPPPAPSATAPAPARTTQPPSAAPTTRPSSAPTPRSTPAKQQQEKATAPAEPPPSPTTASPTPASTTVQAAIEDRLFALANQARAEHGLAPLARNGAMNGVARSWSTHLASAGRALAHNPGYTNQIPSGWTAAGENVAWIGASADPGIVAGRIHGEWMASPGHRKNLLDSRFTAIGIGAAHHPDHGYYLTQNFAAY